MFFVDFWEIIWWIAKKHVSLPILSAHPCAHRCFLLMDKVTIKQVETRKELKQFVRFNYELYRLEFNPDRAKKADVVILRVGFRAKQCPCPAILFGQFCIVHKRVVPSRNDLYAN